jgi:murein DD-endopeptidase MepM/ murein hydrolase activator NlpD
VATLVVAASGALTLNSGLLAMSATGAQGALAGGAPLTLGQLQDERAASADRANRSGRDATADPVADARAKAEARAADRERAAWAQQHDRELRSVRARAAGATDAQVFKRVIQWVLPLSSYKLSSGYGAPGVLWANDHTGQDFAAPMGAPIRAIGAGEITYAGYDGAYGNKIVIRHEDGTETWYCHMSAFEYTGGYVRPGTTIGYVGSTGNSTGPHLHLEVHPGGGDAIDPLPWLRELGLPI